MNETRASVIPFELDRHGVIQASAGTGKTHTIERLVERLLIDEAVPLERILVVTFTEKATGELKTRLRQMLETAVARADQYAPILRPALDQFDQAPIFTIHGFCQRLLQDYAWEQGQDFSASLVDDGELFRTALGDIQRRQWRSFFGADLKAVLEKAGYNRDTAADWDAKVLDIARRFKPRSGHRLVPAPIPEWWRRLDDAGVNGAGQLEIFTIHELHRVVRDFKRQRGLQSFDDMIANVEENLDPDKNRDAPGLLQALRERYRYGIVDEFQDTDPLQWRIFRRIFLDAGDAKLFVVGDPKQAIFGFRGADLPTYLEATRDMLDRHDAARYPLATNWRSIPDLLEAWNCLFGEGEWFPRESGIEYFDLHAPDGDQQANHVDTDRTGRPAMSLVDLADCQTLRSAQKKFAGFVVREIASLLDDKNGPRLTFAQKGKPARPIRAGDICVLVMKRKDADPITQGLDQAGIPYSFYRQTGLWQCEEAGHLGVLLQALARPDQPATFRKALLSCFFRVKPEELVRAVDLPAAHPARQLLQTWLAFTQDRAWSALCRSLLEDTGLLFEHPGEPLAQRRVANQRMMLAALEQAGHSGNLDLLGLIDWLNDRRGVRESGETDLLSADGSAAVQIMTIHASKGLEFPIVFLAGGFTRRGGGGEICYHDDAGRLVFDLFMDEHGKQRVQAEQLAEHRRLLYVAMTRPIFKLYVPRIRIPRRGSQYLGPLGSILLPALELAAPEIKLGGTVADLIAPSDIFHRPSGEGPPHSSPLPPGEGPGVRESPPHAIHIDGPLFPALDPNLGKRRIQTRSFSSLARHHLRLVGDGVSFGEQAAPVEDETAAPLDDDPLRGPVFGDMVHGVLEAIDFGEVARAEAADDLCRPGAPARRLIDDEIKKNIALLRTRTPAQQLEEACRRQIARLVWLALTTPLPALGCPLCRIKKEDRLSEIEFLYPELDRPGTNERFITGFIDFLFRKDGKYYLLDWKTNLLPDYGPAEIERAMDDAEYHRQYRLYLQAIARWLERVHGQDVPILERFGGVFYLFLRGLNGRDDTSGVFFHRPNAADLDLSAAVGQ